MLIAENIRLALSSLWANKMRAILTMLGIIIGIASVITIITLGDAVTGTVTDSMKSMGANNITVGLQQKTAVAETNASGAVFGTEDKGQLIATDDDYFTKEMLENLCATYPDNIQAISASETVGSGQILDSEIYSNVTVSGVSLGYFIANEKTMLAGRYFNENEMSKGEMVAIISDKAVNNMFKGNIQSALGSQIQVCVNNKYVNYTIIGVYEYEASGFGFSSASEKDVNTDMYIPLNSAMSQNHTTGYATLTVVTTEGIDVNAFVGRIEQFMNVYYRNNNNFEVSAFSMASILDTMTTMMSTITLAIAVIAGIALVVGGIGVMNIMLVSITERTREIGTRKALGATNSSIRLQFIVEAMVICLIGGIIGIILGVVGGAVGAKLLGTAATSSLGSIFLSLGFSMAIGIFFGYYPANKAAKMDPIEALRYE